MPLSFATSHVGLLAGVALFAASTVRDAHAQGNGGASTPTSAAPTRLYRRMPNSSALTAPRVFARVFCAPGTLVKTVRFYEALTRTTLDQDMDIPAQGLHVVAVGPFLILEIDRNKLGRADQATKTPVTVLVPDLDAAVAQETAKGATVVQARWSAPPGPGVRLRHPDGLLVEYVEHRPSPYDVAAPGAALR